MNDHSPWEAPDYGPLLAEAADWVARRAGSALIAGRMPAVYLGHGAPPLVDDALWVTQLAAWARALPRPEAILMVSAHWEAAPLTFGADRDGVPLVYDFYGFPERYYRTTYPAPAAPGLAARVRDLLAGDEPVAGAGARARPRRVRAAPGHVPGGGRARPADVDAVAGPGAAVRGRGAAAPAARRGRARDRQRLPHPRPAIPEGLQTDAPPPAWSTDFDHWAAEALGRGDVDELSASAPSRPPPTPTLRRSTSHRCS